MSTLPRVSIIIVSWNGRELMERCLNSLAAAVATPHEIIVVDNSSTDGTPELIVKKFPTVRLIRNTTNRGFSAANNQGLAAARGEFVFFANSDTECIDDPLPVLLRELEADPKIGLIAPRLLNPDRTVQASTRRWPQWTDQVVTLLKLRHLLRSTPLMNRYRDTRTLTATAPVEVDEIMGAAVLGRRARLNTMKGWDEKYWLWFEDVDLCQRVHRAGWRVVYDPRVAVIHYGAQTFGRVISLKKQLWFMTSLWIYAKRYWSPIAAWSLWPFFVVSYALTLLQTIIKPR